MAQYAHRPFFDSSVVATVENLKSNGGVYLYFIEVSNPNGSNAFLQLFNVAAANVTIGTTVPNQSYLVPANGGMDIAFSDPLEFDTALSYAATTTATGSTAPGTGLVLNIGWR